MAGKVYEFSAIIRKVPDMDGAYIEFPYDARAEFGRGRVKASARFDGELYEGSIVNMGLKREDGSICYVMGIPKALRKKIGKQGDDTVSVQITGRE